MIEYDVMYKGIVIGNVQADNKRAALVLANQIYGGGSGPITVEKV